MREVEMKAKALAFGDDATADIEAEIDLLKARYTTKGDPRALFSNPRFKALQTELKDIATDRTSIELALQTYPSKVPTSQQSATRPRQQKYHPPGAAVRTGYSQ